MLSAYVFCHQYSSQPTSKKSPWTTRRLRHVGEQPFRHVAVRDDVIEIDLHRRILQLEVIVDRPELQRLRGCAERIRRDRALAKRDLAEQSFRPLVRDDRQPLRHRLADAARVIEVMMRDDELGHGLSGHRRARAIDERLVHAWLDGASNIVR